EDRRRDDPRHIGDQLADGAARSVVSDNEDVALLQVAPRGRRERAGAEKPQQRGFDDLVAVAPLRAMTRDSRKLIQTGKARIDAEGFAKTLDQRLSNAGDEAIVGHARTQEQ